MTAEGTTVVTGFAMDAAGNVGQSAPTTVKIDKTPPEPKLTVSGNVAPIGSSVTADFSCTDSFSGVAPASSSSTVWTPPAAPGQVVLESATPHMYTLEVRSTDVAGNAATSAPAIVEFKQFRSRRTCRLSSNQITVGRSVTANSGVAGRLQV